MSERRLKIINIGTRIKLLREKLGMSQDELAQKLGYSSRSAISKVEKGQRDVKQHKIVEYANALNTTPAYLMGWEEVEKEISELINTEKEPPNEKWETLQKKIMQLDDTKLEQLSSYLDFLIQNQEK